MAPKLQKFDNHFLEIPSTILVLGPTNSGKTALVSKLIERWTSVTNSGDPIDKLVICYGGKYQDAYEEMLDSLDPSSEGEIHCNFPRNLSWNSNRTNVLILDDIFGEELKKNVELERIFCVDSHHEKVTCILILQDLTCQSQTIRTCLRNAQYIFLTPSSKNGTLLVTLQRMLFPSKRGYLSACWDLCFREGGKIGDYMLIDCSTGCPSDFRVRTGLMEDLGKIFMPERKM